MKLRLKDKRKNKDKKKKECFIKKYTHEILVFVFFVLIRLPSLGHDNFNTDVWRWKARSYDFGNGLSTGNFEMTLQKYHPGVTLMWIGSVGAKVNNVYSELSGQSLLADENVSVVFRLDFIQKIILVVVLGITTSFVFYALRNIVDLKYALVAVFLLSLEPFYLGLTRVFHLEGLVSTFMLASVVWLYYFFVDDKKKSRLIISAIFAGLAILTKTSSIFLVLFTGLTTLIHSFRKGNYKIIHKNTWLFNFKNLFSVLKDFSKIFFPWLLVFIGVFFLLWPAMWEIPWKVIQTLYSGVTDVGVEGDHFQFYFGNLVEDPGPGFYFVVLALRSSVYLLVGFIGMFFIKRKLPDQRKEFFNFLLIFVFFYFIQLIIPTKKLDRYILPVFVVISLLSSGFFVWLYEKIKFKESWQKVLSIFIFICFAIWPNLVVHPDYLSYFNPMFGGLKKGIRVLEPKWLIGQEDIVNYFKYLPEEENAVFSSGKSFEELVYKNGGKDLLHITTVGFKEKYYTQIWPFFREYGSWAVVKELAPFAERTKYFVYPIWDDTSQEDTELKLSYFGTIDIRGVPVYVVYRNGRNGVYAK